jgi:hypothetical protein
MENEMVTFKQHRPPMVDAGEFIQVEFNSIDELLNHPWIKQWKSNDKFYRFSLSETNTLMCEINYGKNWFILGYLDSPVDLPKWEPRE